MVLVLVAAMILALIVLPYYRLALRFNKSTWWYSLLGLLVFIAPGLLLVILSTVFLLSKYQGDVAPKSLGGGEILFLLGVIVSFFFYRYLERKWMNEPKGVGDEGVLDDLPK